MDPIPVNLEELGNALDDGGGLAEHRWYLDLRNGNILLVSEFGDFPEEYDDVQEQPEVFLYIEPRSSREGFQTMEDYVDGLPEGEARRALDRALRLPKPFRSFKDTLFDFPAERETWFSFQNQRQREAAIRFLEENQVPWVEAHKSPS
jgi:hypothetical protein